MERCSHTYIAHRPPPTRVHIKILPVEEACRAESLNLIVSRLLCVHMCVCVCASFLPCMYVYDWVPGLLERRDFCVVT